MLIVQKIRNRLHNEAGFTLMEMLIVLFVIGALITIILPNLTNAGVEAQHKSCEANKKVILAQAEAYFLENGQKYPDDVAVLVNEGYLREAPFCPLETDEGAVTSYKLVEIEDGETLNKHSMLMVTCNHHDEPSGGGASGE